MGVLALKSRRDSIVRSMFDALVTVPSYAVLQETARSTLFEELHHALDRTLELASSDEAVSEPDLEFFGEIGRRRGDDLFPLDDLRAGFKLSYIAGLRDVFEVAGASNHSDLIDLSAYGAREHPRMLEAAVLTYAASYRMHATRDPARALLTERLLEGKDAASVAKAAGVTLPNAYVVLVCRGASSQADPGVAGRGNIDEHLSAVPGALWRGGLAEGLTILLPTDSSSVDTAAAVTEELVRALGKTTRLGLHAVHSRPTSIKDLAYAYDEVQQALVVLTAIPDARGRPYRIEELLVELAMLRQPYLRARMAELTRPLSAGSDLRHTLDALFAHDLDRERTAKALYIHRRTLTYRIKRIRELSGLDPATPHGIQLLRLALTANHLPPTGSGSGQQ